ncbi:target of Nesh-SH3 isoform X5 [Mixophyes fleayi]|uniref:target of Nesh-SH3 isoform X5 n=1 Tax=Mixophyes fleayi TaxID=3061075 RepID=UPI003F4DD2A3
MISRFFFLLLCGIISAHLGDAQKLPKVKKLNMKVHINITGDTLVMKFHRPYQSIKLEGFILGYGSNYFTNQYIQWPDNGKSYITDVEAETRYLIAVKPNDNPKKSCKEKNSSQKPLQLVIGSLTPTSVFLSWGILINPQVDWSALNKCPNDRFYTVRYREKNKDWLFQLCPTTETVIDNLKPNTMYEFGVKDNSDEGIWSKPQNHKTNLKGKENGNIENSYKIPKATLQYASEDTKTLIPVYVVKQGFQNVTKSTPAPPPTARSPVLKKETKKPHLRTTTRTPTPKPVSKVTESPPITKPPGKAVDEDPKAALTSRPIVESFTPESSAGTLEWVRATMVTHPYVQVTNIPTEPSVSHGQSTPLVFVRDYNGAPRESTDIPTKESLPTLDPPRAKTASLTIAPVPFTNEPPTEQPETVLARERLATYVPQAMNIPQSSYAGEMPVFTDVPQTTHLPAEQQKTTLGMHPVSTDTPEVSSSKSLKRQRSTLGVTRKITSVTVGQTSSTQAGIQPKSIDVPQRGTDLPLIIHRTASATPSVTMKTTSASAGQLSATHGVLPISTYVPQVTTHSPLKKHRTTLAANEKQPIYVPSTVSSLGKLQTHHATTSQNIPAKQSILPSQTHTPTSAFTGSLHIPTTHQSIAKIEVPHSTPVPKETASFHPKPFPSTEAPHMEPDSTQPDSEIHTSEAPHTYEPDKITLASDDKTVVQKLTSTSKPETTTVYRTTSMSFKSNTPATSQRTQSTEALKRTGVSPAHPKIPLPEETYPTAVLKDMQPTKLVEETTTIMVPTETQKMSPKKIHITESPSPPADPKTSHLVPPDVLGFDIFEHPVLPLVPNKTEKVIPLKSDKTAPPATAVPKAMQTKGMPINLIRIHIFEDPTVPSAKIETQTTSPPTPKTTSKSTHWVPINVIRLHIFEDPDVPKVPNTTIAPLQPTTTKSPESPHSKPVPTQKISQRISKKPKPTPHAKPASTEAPKDTIKPKIQHVTLATTLAPYRLQTQRPKASVRPRTRFAQNGTTQGVGDFNYVPGTLPGGRVFDSTKLLGGSTNISMTPNNTGKRTFSVSSTPLPPVRPTNIRRRIQPGNITGSSPPFQPVRPTSIRRRPQPTNVTGRPGHAGDILIPRAPSTARPNHTTISIKTPKKQPTLPAPEEDLVETTVFSPSPKSDIDALGKSRYVAPHVMYMSKDEKIPCSITESMKYFPVEEGSNQEIINAPQNPPSNLTVVTVEGCPSFVILDWDQPDNDTVTEYEVISKENGAPPGKDQSILVTNQTHSTVENLKPDTSYEFHVIPKNPLGEGPVSATVEFNTESADPRVSEPVSGGKDAIWTEIKFKSDSYSECRGKQFVKRTWYKKFVGIQLCNSLRYKIYLSDTLSGKFYNIGDQSGYGEDHCQFVDSFLDGRTGQQLLPEYLVPRQGFYRSVRQQPVDFGNIGGQTHISYVHWYECGIAIPGKW